MHFRFKVLGNFWVTAYMKKVAYVHE